MFYIPEFNGSLAHWMTIIIAFAFPVFYAAEATGWFSLGYSKFARQQQRYSVPSRLGMFLIYFPAIVIYPAVYYGGGAPESTWHTIAMVLVLAHFAKRCLETLFVHKYSGVMNGWTVLVVGSLYSTLAWLLAEVATHDVTPELVEAEGFEDLLVVGLAIWTVGQLLNYWHHRLLANLRKPGETGYKLPRGGLFRFVACPHYFAEVIAWVGYALFFHHISGAVLTVFMASYLMGRSHNTVKWYRNKLGEVPPGWRRMIPFIY